MSLVKLTLRPPPNVDFVDGYPGIPPGQDRRQAGVKGTIEVRAGVAGVKAQYVRIELRKVETLPGGGPANTFFDYVGAGPIPLWQSSDEYSLLQTQDFPFFIRIPESIPPTISIEKNAGIRYELIATACIVGKKGFLRRRKSIIQTTTAPIIIDKHELHSTWPLYQQPESRQITNEGVTLIIERAQTCYGPGDRVAVTATLKSGSLHPVILRGFEFTLKETSLFRGAASSSKKSGPQIKTATIGEQKVPVNATIYGGLQHRAELHCVIPKDHTTTSLTSARHIDITYVINVKALMGTGTHVVMDLPVIVSNWPRGVSIEAVRRIGAAPSLTLTAPDVANSAGTGAYLPSIHSKSNLSSNDDRHGNKFSTAPGYVNDSDEFGIISDGSRNGGARTMNDAWNSRYPLTKANDRIHDDISTPPSLSQNTKTSTNSQRFTVSNPEPDPMEQMLQPRSQQQRSQPEASHNRNVSASDRPAPTEVPQRQWMSAEEEKKRLYENARAKVELLHATLSELEDSGSTPPLQSQSHVTPTHSTLSPSSTTQTRWPSAEDEKRRLYEQAKALARHNQPGDETYAIPELAAEATASNRATLASGASMLGRQLSNGSTSSRHNHYPHHASYQQHLHHARAGPSSTELFNSAMSNVNNRGGEASLPQPSSSPSLRHAGGSGSPAIPHYYLSAEDEKATIRRFHEAIEAVKRTHSADYAQGEDDMDSMYASGSELRGYMGSNGTTAATSPPRDDPPPFEGPSTSAMPASAMMEKERLRQRYAAEEAAAAAVAATATNVNQANGARPYALSPTSPPQPQQRPASPPEYSYSMHSSPVASGSSGNYPRYNEKEALQRFFANQDAAALGAGRPSSPPQPPVSRSVSGGFPPVSGGQSQQPRRGRSPPLPPVGGSMQPLTAAQEKALLKAKMDAEAFQARALQEQQAQQQQQRQPQPPQPPQSQPQDQMPDFSSIPPPPPLMPRPPAEYIRETQEEDMDVRQSLTVNGTYNNGTANGHLPADLELRPFTPFSDGFSAAIGNGRSYPPPPLPPKARFSDETEP